MSASRQRYVWPAPVGESLLRGRFFNCGEGLAREILDHRRVYDLGVRTRENDWNFAPLTYTAK
jgi:hypothetical protein